MQAEKLGVRCPPWALPREEVPIQVEIEKDVTAALREVVFELPASLRLADTINILDLEESGGRLAVRAIDTARRSEYDYFGIVVATRAPFDELGKEVPVRVSFVMRDGSVDACVAPVRVFRPRLEFADAPDVIVLGGAGPRGRPVPIRLKYSGFGDVTVRARCAIGECTVSRETPFLGEILGRLLRYPAPHSGAALPCFAIEADPAPAALTAEEVKERLLSEDSARGMLNSGKIGADAARMPHALAGSGKEEIADPIRQTMPSVVAGILSDIQARTPGENVRLESRTAIVVPAEPPPGPLVVELWYADVLGNEYGPIKRTIQIDDRRAAGSGAGLEVPLDITADESGAYRNVGEMAIGARC